MISVLLPTRERPVMLRQMLTHLFANAERPDEVEAILYVDDDDEVTKTVSLEAWNARRIIGPRQSMGRINTACLHAATGDIVILGNDDIIVQTAGWDARVRESAAGFSDDIYLLYPNDLLKGKRLSTFPILSRKVCQAIGDPFPAAYGGAFIDVHLMDIFKRLGGYGEDRLVYLKDVIFEHLHQKVGKSALDSTYRARARFGDDQTFLLLENERQQAAHQLAGLIEGLSDMQAKKKEHGEKASMSARASLWRLLTGGSSSLSWRLYLFAWLSARQAYRILLRAS